MDACQWFSQNQNETKELKKNLAGISESSVAK